MNVQLKFQSNDIFYCSNSILTISPLMVSSNNVKVSQKHCIWDLIESFTNSPQSEQITLQSEQIIGSYADDLISIGLVFEFLSYSFFLFAQEVCFWQSFERGSIVEFI